MPDESRGHTDTPLVNLPDDVLSVVTRSLSPRDICNLGLTCRSLRSGLLGSEKVWFAQCEALAIVAPRDLTRWRSAVSSYKSLCRFMSAVKPLMGMWVHQNPELGNVVYVIPGFVSAVGCRVIPQELSPLGLDRGPILWAPVFEVLSDRHGRASLFLHGREDGAEFLYPGSLGPVDPACNVMLLEVELDSEPEVPFSRLAFSDRRKLLEFVTTRVRFSLPDGDPIQRWTAMITETSKSRIEFAAAELHPPEREIKRNPPPGSNNNKLGKYFRQLLGKSTAAKTGSSSSSSSSSPSLDEFLRAGEAIGLTVRATMAKLSSYRAWPNMHESRFALYKLPLRAPTPGQELSGLWGGSFGWPPGQLTEDKPGKALFLLLLSYEDSGKVLIATKILEGTHYVLHPNGSAMFVVDTHEPSAERFPWETGAVRGVFSGEGIANGYGFRYPGSKPGSLFVFEDGGLAFMWKESRAVLTLRRLDLQELIGRGERVAPLPPIPNFSYLTKSYSNVFAGFPASSPRSPLFPEVQYESNDLLELEELE